MRRYALRWLPHAAFLSLLAIASALAWQINGALFPSSGLPSVWFYSGLALLLFSMFYVEPHYGAPKNVMTNSMAVILVLLSVRTELQDLPGASPWYQILLLYSAGTLAASWLASNLGREDEGPDHWTNRTSEALKNISVIAGEARVLFSGVFLLFLPLFHSIDDRAVIAALVFWWIVVMTNPQKRIASTLEEAKARRDEVAAITGVQSRRVFLARIYPGSPVVKALDPVEFTYAIDRGANPLKRGIVLGSHLLEDEKWIKVLELESAAPDPNRRPNTIYKMAEPTPRIADILGRFLGVIVERSEIGTVVFELIPGGPPVQEGELVEVLVGAERIFYQIINARTGKESLEAKNESGFIVNNGLKVDRSSG